MNPQAGVDDAPMAMATCISTRVLLRQQINKNTYPLTLWARLWISLFTMRETRTSLGAAVTASFLGSAAVCVFAGSRLC